MSMLLKPELMDQLMYKQPFITPKTPTFTKYLETKNKDVLKPDITKRK